MSHQPVQATVWLPVDPDTALRQFVDTEALRAWWGVAHALVEPTPGGVWTVGWERSSGGYRYITTGTISRYEPGAELEIERVVYVHPEQPMLGPMKLRVSVERESEGTRLTVRQDGYQSGPAWDWYHAAVTEGWPAALELLQRHLHAQRDAAR
jgi:uncharacterized protein YndB with AHSA1/START domain